MSTELQEAALRLRTWAHFLRGTIHSGVLYAHEIPYRAAIREKIETLELVADALDPREDHGK